MDFLRLSSFKRMFRKGVIVLLPFVFLVLPSWNSGVRYGISSVYAAVSPLQATAKENYSSLYLKAQNVFRLANHTRDYEEAIYYFKKANKERDGASAECLIGIVKAYYKLGSNKNVQKTCDVLIRVSEGNNMDLAQAWNFKGLSYLNAAANKQDEKMLRKAADSFREVLKLFPNNDRARYNLGNTLIRLNEDAAGIRELHEYIEKSDDDELIKEARRIIGNPRRARENYAPEYSLETTDGRVITSDDLLGKVVLFNFWINLDWSGVDRIVSDLKKMAEKHPNEPLVIVNLSLGFSGTPGPIWDDYFEEKNIHWPVVIRGSRKIAEKFGAKPSYTFIVIDHEGIIRYRRAFDPFSSDIVSSISGVINDSLKDLAKSKE